MRGDAGNGASISRRGPKVVLGMLGAVALMAGTAVVALANHVEALSVSCFDTWTTGSVTIDDAQTGNYVGLEAWAYNGTTWVDTGDGTTVTIPGPSTTYNGTASSVYVTTWSINITDSAYFSSSYTKWEIAYGSSSGVDNSNGVLPVTSTTLCSPVPNLPESPLAVALPLAGLAIFAGAFGFVIRRRRRSASAV
jgi:hypothetical protein